MFRFKTTSTTPDHEQGGQADPSLRPSAAAKPLPSEKSAENTSTNEQHSETIDFPIIVDRKMIYGNEKQPPIDNEDAPALIDRVPSFDADDVDLSVIKEVNDLAMGGESPVINTSDFEHDPNLSFLPGLSKIGKLLSEEEKAQPNLETADLSKTPEDHTGSILLKNSLFRTVVVFGITFFSILGACAIYQWASPIAAPDTLLHEDIIDVSARVQMIETGSLVAELKQSWMEAYNEWANAGSVEIVPERNSPMVSLRFNGRQALAKWCNRDGGNTEANTGAGAFVTVKVFLALALVIVSGLSNGNTNEKVTFDAGPLVKFLSSYKTSGKGRLSPSCKNKKKGKYTVSAYSALTICEIDEILHNFGSNEVVASKAEKIDVLVKQYEKVLLAMSHGDILSILKARDIPFCNKAKKAALARLLIESGF